MLAAWRHIRKASVTDAETDRKWHCFTEGEPLSLCGAHDLMRHGATADLVDIPKETRCPFCEAAYRIERKKVLPAT